MPWLADWGPAVMAYFQGHQEISPFSPPPALVSQPGQSLVPEIAPSETNDSVSGHNLSLDQRLQPRKPMGAEQVI